MPRRTRVKDTATDYSLGQQFGGNIPTNCLPAYTSRWLGRCMCSPNNLGHVSACESDVEGKGTSYPNCLAKLRILGCRKIVFP